MALRLTPTRYRRRAAVPLVLAAVAATGGAVFQQAGGSTASAAVSPAQHRDTAATRLICSGHGTLKSDKPVTDTPTTVNWTGTGTIDKCFPRNGGPTNLVSGTVSATGSATLGCSSLGTYSGTATVVWYSGPNRTGSVVGTSVITTDGTQDVEGDPADNEVVSEPDGTVSLTSGVLPGAAVTGSGFPTSDISHCSAGLSSGSGKFAVRFNELL